MRHFQTLDDLFCCMIFVVSAIAFWYVIAWVVGTVVKLIFPVVVMFVFMVVFNEHYSTVLPKLVKHGTEFLSKIGNQNDHVNTVGFTKQSGVSSRGPPPVDTAGARLTFFKPGSSSRKARKSLQTPSGPRRTESTSKTQQAQDLAPNCHSEPGGMSSNQQLGTGNEEDEQRSLSASRCRACASLKLLAEVSTVCPM
ncbi:regulator of chromosome condensation [Culex quinquefasciatus]|uniref:Regulator of chromosome condensation n=1 Tax=Culex quinquefasciatus TaxID=7176 RepID=B0WET2_CULQU|nr:regulator of chromosome condensation [Culex quinquefasciatus]|eukprot:XP_001847216.1 regulator of chromosome condensation [Culex quinquefasciatus]